MLAAIAIQCRRRQRIAYPRRPGVRSLSGTRVLFPAAVSVDARAQAVVVIRRWSSRGIDRSWFNPRFSSSAGSPSVPTALEFAITQSSSAISPSDGSSPNLASQVCCGSLEGCSEIDILLLRRGFHEGIEVSPCDSAFSTRISIALDTLRALAEGCLKV